MDWQATAPDLCHTLGSPTNVADRGQHLSFSDDCQLDDDPSGHKQLLTVSPLSLSRLVCLPLPPSPRLLDPQVYVYHKGFPVPITSHKFHAVDPVSGVASDDDSGQFVSSVCWRKGSSTLVAGNSVGNVKLLDLK
jgi:hypothetical protein